MDFGDLSGWFAVPLQILLVDLLLGADNALVIALACRRLPPEEVRRAAMLGVGGAIALRILLSIVASALLALPFLKLIGGAILLLIALRLIAGEETAEPARAARPGAKLWSAVGIILVADTTMSLDNVVALAAIARGNIGWLMIGVAMSLPIIAFGGVMLAGLLQRAAWLVDLGAALLGWIALQMAVSDEVFGGAIEINAPALAALAPALGAAFVWLYARLVAPPRPVAEVAAVAEVVAVAEVTDLGPTLRDEAPRSATSATAEPDDHHEPPATIRSRDDRAAIIGVLLLAVAAGAFLMIVSWLDSFN